MSESYHRICLEERNFIYSQLILGYNYSAIAKMLKRHKSSIWREINRNGGKEGYNIFSAQNNYQHKLYHRKKSFWHKSQIKEYVVDKLVNKKWSPEQIAGRTRRDKLGFTISTQSIYNFIESKEGLELNLRSCLRFKNKRMSKFGKCGSKKCKIPDLVPIKLRPEYINERNDIGHFEADLIVNSISKQQNILHIVERKSRYSCLVKVKSKRATNIAKKIKSRIEGLPVKAKSMTFDRGLEFAGHKKLGIATYFCNPASPWQKGQVENQNGRVRSLIPKNAAHRYLSEKNIDKVETLLNNTPRKVLGYLTPLEVLLSSVALDP